jgi:hypothetical protein
VSVITDIAERQDMTTPTSKQAHPVVIHLQALDECFSPDNAIGRAFKKTIDDALSYISHLESNIAQARAEALEEAVKIVLGWKESDRPEGFDRRTAGALAMEIADRIRALKVNP